MEFFFFSLAWEQPNSVTYGHLTQSVLLIIMMIVAMWSQAHFVVSHIHRIQCEFLKHFEWEFNFGNHLSANGIRIHFKNCGGLLHNEFVKCISKWFFFFFFHRNMTIEHFLPIFFIHFSLKFHFNYSQFCSRFWYFNICLWFWWFESNVNMQIKLIDSDGSQRSDWIFSLNIGFDKN